MHVGSSPKRALFWKKLSGNRVRCELCPFFCVIGDGKRGNCNVRENRNGVLYTLVYGKVVAYHVDPIEKKPLYHFAPGTKTFSIATVGCNLHCQHCQNWEISQAKMVFGRDMSPEEVVTNTIELETSGISYTYTEPTIFYEFAFDTMKLARKHSLYNVFVTNGFINEKPLKKLKGLLDAANVDIKAFSDRFYREVCKAPSYEHATKTVELMHDLGMHVEVTYLIIPNRNDSMEEIKSMVKWLVELDPDIPLHFSRYHPDFMLNEPPTPLETLVKARELAKKEGVRYVYLGNVAERDALNTYCWKCGVLLIQRGYMHLEKIMVKDGKCPNCGERVNLRGMEYVEMSGDD